MIEKFIGDLECGTEANLTRCVSPSCPLTLANPVTLYACLVTNPFLNYFDIDNCNKSSLNT